MSRVRLAETSLRSKLLITVLGAAVLLVAATTLISQRYWRDQARLAAEQQALLTARTLHAMLEPSLRYGRWEEARAQLEEITQRSELTSARVYDEHHTVVLAMEHDLGPTPSRTRWIPRWSDIPNDGLVRIVDDGTTALAYEHLHTAGHHVLEVGFPTAPVEAAMLRASQLGNTLLIGSIVALGVILLTMVQREVVAPVRRIDRLLATNESSGSSSTRNPDELERIQARVSRLLDEEREFESKEGLAQVGQLAAEMAHEFKRPLASIFMALDLFRQEYEMGEKEQTLLGNMEGQLDRIDETMRDLLALAKPVEVDMQSIDLCTVVDDVLIQLSPLISAQNVEVERYCAEDVAPVMGDRKRVEMALANVVLNAVQAMPEGGKLDLSMRPRDREMTFCVSDNGSGMTESQVQQALRPFYTTKAEGTGLGLSLVARVVEAHGGRLTIASIPKEGTTVTIALPLDIDAVAISQSSAGENDA